MFTPSPSQSLLNAELRMLSAIKTPFTRHQVTGLNTISSLSTFHTNKNVLLIHGWAGGVGIWVNNWDGIFNSKPTNLHAIDLKGWASSSRPKFCGTTPESAQSWWVDSIEEWRVKMDIPKLSIAAHSMGGFIATSYALKYPDRISDLTLISPIGLGGFQVPNDSPSISRAFIRSFVLSQVWKFTPQRLLTLVKESRVKKLIQNSRKSTQLAFPFTDDTVANYILQMNRSKNVSGAVAFSKLLTPTGWKLPLAPLIPSIRNRFPVSILYGSNDWIDATWAVENSKKAFGDETKVYIVPGCGHHLYAEGAEFVDEIISNGKSTKLKEVTSIEQLEKLKSASRLKIS